jgi:hypothetical protein
VIDLYTTVIHRLEEEGFQLFEKSKDGFYESYVHPDAKENNLYTLIYFTTAGTVIDVLIGKLN